MIPSNIVAKTKTREIQSETLGIISKALINSFGPFGSNTIITKALDGPITYTKDGHTILKNINFSGIIEQSVKTDLENLTAHIVKTVGDGTTSALVLSQIIFNEFNKLDGKYAPYELIEKFKDTVKVICEMIHKNARPFDAQSAYDITYIATNGNSEVASNVKNIYEKYGTSVFIEVSASTGTESFLKIYDGMTLNTGYSDTAYINTTSATCDIRNARVYYFEDPIDTVEMSSLLNKIVSYNIIEPYQDGCDRDPIPTVIIAPQVSRDMIPYITKLIDFMYQFSERDLAAKPPFLLITNTHEIEALDDIARMCGCLPIKKYIDLKLQEKDIESGLAPTLDTVCKFCGSAEEVVADVAKTKFINPALINDPKDPTKRSSTFNTLVQFLEDELAKVISNGGDANQIGKLKKRIHSLKSNMVEYIVGGVSIGDRDALKHLIEDAVLNCRSASIYGVGYGSNLEAALAVNKLLEADECTDILTIISKSYHDLLLDLYRTSSVDRAEEWVNGAIYEKKMPYDLRTNKYSDKVVCSIETDVVILETIAKIVSLMFTANQFLCPATHYNNYMVME